MDKTQPPVHYIHRMSYSVQERLVGIFVLSALVVIFGLIFVNSQTAHIFEDRITLNTYLTKAEGISTATKVKVSGFEVGKVTSLDIASDHRIHVKLIIYKRYQSLLREDSKAAIGTLSILGKPVIEITAGSTDKMMLLDGAEIVVEEPLSIDELLAGLTPVIEGVESSVKRFAEIIAQIEPQQVGTIVANIDESAKAIQRISSKMDSSEGTVGMAINDPAFQKQITSTVSSMEIALIQLDKRLNEFESTSKNINKSSEEFPAITSELKKVLTNTSAMLTTINIELKQLPQLVTRMNVLMEETDRLLEGINNSWLFSNEEGKLRRKLIEVQPYHE